MKITLANHLGMCFGVRDAIALAKQQANRHPLTILGQLVHNPGVVAELERSGIRSVPRDQSIETEAVMISAHGSSNKVRQALAESRHDVHDATCPLVHHAHRQLESLVAMGCFPVVIGVNGHVEVNGLVDDLADYRVVLSLRDIERLPHHQHYGVVAQTTQPINRVRTLVDAIKHRFPASRLSFRDTVCQPTKNRQKAANDLAQASDIVIVIGGEGSNNTKELVAASSLHCDRVFRVQSPRDLKRSWFYPTDRIGITAGTSTPDNQIQAIVTNLKAWLRESDKTSQKDTNIASRDSLIIA